MVGTGTRTRTWLPTSLANILHYSICEKGDNIRMICRSVRSNDHCWVCGWHIWEIFPNRASFLLSRLLLMSFLRLLESIQHLIDTLGFIRLHKQKHNAFTISHHSLLILNYLFYGLNPKTQVQLNWAAYTLINLTNHQTLETPTNLHISEKIEPKIGWKRCLYSSFFPKF